jgi:hypothetical protein
LTTTKFKPLIFSLSGFTLSFAANMFILIILYGLCLLHAQFCYIIVCIRKVVKDVQIEDRCAPWKTSSGVEILAFQALQFEEVGFCCKFSGRASTSHYWSNHCFMEA